MKLSRIIFFVTLSLTAIFFSLRSHYHTNGSKVSQTKVASLYSQTTNKQKNNLEGRAPASKMATTQKPKSQNENLSQLQEILGQDEIGQKAFILLQRTMIKHQQKNLRPELQIECLTQKNCPVPLTTFYKKVFERLPLREFARQRLWMQENLLASELDRVSKAKILAAELTSPEFSQLEATSVRTKDGHGQLGDDVIYMVATQNHLVRLGLPAEQIIRYSLTAISNSQDPVGKLMTGINLLKLYPQHASQVQPELLKLGLTQEQIAKALQGRP